MKKAGFFALTAVFAVSGVMAGVPGKVNADWLNMRTGAGLESPVAGKIPQGTGVDIRREVGNWLEISAPAALKLYISEARVNPGGVLNGELNLRTAMSDSAPTLGLLPKGAKVKLLEERRNGWVRIAPPETVIVYVAAFCVDYDKSAFDAQGLPKTAAAPETRPEAKSEAKPAAPETKPEVKPEAAPAADAGKAVELKGVLTAWKYSKSPDTAFALLDSPKGCCIGFVAGDKEKLAALDGRIVTVSGRITGRTEAGTILVAADAVTENAAEEASK
ncbi:MAG: SH3 domain-containing protein [Lentisphaeria bacterium]|nr:SH3 domain-containing protein [Lentisphaeria bacterium]